MKKLLCLLLTLVLLLSAGCTPAQNTAAGTTQGTQGTAGTEDNVNISGNYKLDETRNEAIIDDAGQVTALNTGNARVFYQIFVGSFSDSDGDGIGDLRGIINRFDYLNDGKENSGVSLGVEGIWLSPIFLSPSYHKYDVTDYYKIDPQFGTEADLQELIDLCHARGVKLILDLVVNHTAKNNQWFQLFTNAHKMGDTESPYYDYYVYSTTGEVGRTFSSLAGTDIRYECNFSTEMPELNFDNPTVRQEMLAIAKYYLDMGIDGFRFDAAKYIYYGEDSRSAEFWDWYMAELRKIKPDIFSVAEVWSADNAVYPYYSSTDCFNFSTSQSSGMIASAAKGGNVDSLTAYVQSYVEKIKTYRPDAMMMPFLANHDTDRAAGFLTVSKGHAHMAASLNILMPGAPFIYYGEEIGMKGSRGSANTDANRRLAMLWGDGDTVRDPSGTTYKKDSQTNGTVADQLPSATSLYTHYKRLIQIRKANPEIAYGTYTALKVEGTKAGGFVSTLGDSSVCVLHNTTTEAVTIDLATLGDQVAAMKLSAFAGLGGVTLEGTMLTIDAMTTAILR